MNTEVSNQEQALRLAPEVGAWDTVRSSKSRFVSSRLRKSSIYGWLRSSVAIVAVLFVWGVVTTKLHPGSLSAFLNVTVTVRHITLSLLVFLVWNLCFAWVPRAAAQPWAVVLQELRLILLASLASATVLLLPGVLSARHVFHLYLFATLAAVLVTAAVSLLAAAWLVYGHISPYIAAPRRCLIVGSGKRASALRRILVDEPGVYEIVGCIDDEYVGNDAGRDRYLGRVDALEHLLRTHPIDSIFIGLPVKSCYDRIQEVIRIAESVGAEAHYLTDIFSTSVARHVHHGQHRHFTVLRVTHHDERRHIKRMFDIVGAAALLVGTLPVWLAAAAAVKLTSEGPLFFVQERYGKDRQRFRMFKFRTMVPNAEKLQAALEHQNEVQGPVFKIKRDPRITRVGALLRRTSIDELPQLLNVLRGEMSLVGPRPLPVRDVARFEESWLLRRFSVKPGLTCLWQVSGRSNTTFDFWIRQDLRYIDTWSLRLDMKILFKTVAVVLRGSGAM